MTNKNFTPILCNVTLTGNDRGQRSLLAFDGRSVHFLANMHFGAADPNGL